jgi:succinate dehydrogenase / fumarate reductase iron-sulfur subunit
LRSGAQDKPANYETYPMRIHLRIWRQPGPTQPGQLLAYTAENVLADMSFLEMLDVVNESLIIKGDDPIAFDSDCREGICGACGFLINGIPHGPDPGTTVCQLHMRRFKDGDTVVLEPWRARAFPLVKDLVVDRSAFDRIIQAGGYTSINVGGAQDANGILIPRRTVEQAMDSAACIGCGACVAACKNASAALFTSAKVSHLALLPQGSVERQTRVVSMVERHDAEGFGSCSNEGECEAVCPKEISITNIARMNREFFKAMLVSPP